MEAASLTSWHAFPHSRTRGLHCQFALLEKRLRPIAGPPDHHGPHRRAVLVTRRAKIDALFRRLIDLFRRHQRYGLDTKGSAGVAGKRNRRCTYVVWQVHYYVKVVLTEREVESIQLSANTLQRLLRCFNSF
jgi:hypothetical protein